MNIRSPVLIANGIYAGAVRGSCGRTNPIPYDLVTKRW